MEVQDGEKSRQAAVQISEWPAAAWKGPTYDVLASVCFYLGHAQPCPGLRTWPLKWRVSKIGRGCGIIQPWALPRTPVPPVMTAGLAFPIVYPLLMMLQACADISASTTFCYESGNQQRISWVFLHHIPNSFLPWKAFLVRMRSWINYKHPILIQWLPTMLRSATAPWLNYAWTHSC